MVASWLARCLANKNSNCKSLYVKDMYPYSISNKQRDFQ